jgi:hypothetical protein
MSNLASASCCSRCGIATDQQVGGITICDACYISSGSCCTEFDDEAGEVIEAARPQFSRRQTRCASIDGGEGSSKTKR